MSKLQSVVNFDSDFILQPDFTTPPFPWCNSRVLIQGKGRVQRIVQFQLTFLLRWANKKMNGKLEKNMNYIDNKIIT